jgi:hypothetical protein
MSLDTYNEQPGFKDMLQQLPVTLQLQFQLSTILARAHKTFEELGLLTMNVQQERTLDSVLKMLSSQIDSIESNATSGKYTKLNSTILAYVITRMGLLLHSSCSPRNQCDAFF